MNKIIPKNLLKERLTKQGFLTKRYSYAVKDDDDLKKEQSLNREKGGKTKTESIQEESYFHKEDVEQLKELKKKMKKDKKPEAEGSK